MGGHASRDALDIDLVRTEIEMLMSGLPLLGDIKEYSRMVDDIQNIMQGEFRNVIKAVSFMARSYPTMPLNVQVSFCYSRFLDVHLYNILNTNSPVYNLYTTLAWKEMNSFCYSPASSNKYPQYLTSVVPITMHRIERRCTDKRDKQSHEAFMVRILESRGLDMTGVRKRMTVFKKRKTVRSSRSYTVSSRSYTVTYDSVSKTHEFVISMIRHSDTSQCMRPIHISHATLASVLCPKREIMKRVKDHEDAT